jgi:hypothetical protein
MTVFDLLVGKPEGTAMLEILLSYPDRLTETDWERYRKTRLQILLQA